MREYVGRVAAWVRHIMHKHVRFDPNISSEKLAKHSRLQTWTLKPAWLSPQGERHAMKVEFL